MSASFAATSAAPWELLATIWAVASPEALISRSMRNTGMPTSTALRTAPSVESAPALSQMIAAAPWEIAESKSSDCLLTSSP